MQRNIQFLLAYDGSNFHGWQAQAGVRTVQEEFEKVLRRVLRHPVDLIASGRTDAGVHAAGQVANCLSASKLPPERLQHAIGTRLPEDISLVRVRDVAPAFHATRSARSKLYRYRVCRAAYRASCNHRRKQAYDYQRPLDAQRMREAARLFIGTHNFRALSCSRSPEPASFVRTVSRCEVYRVLDEVRIDVQGSGFLYKQVRNMVGTLLEVGRGRWSPEQVAKIIDSEARQTCGPTAPARGLCLQWVDYPPDDLLSVQGNPPQGAGPAGREANGDLPRSEEIESAGAVARDDDPGQ